MRGRTVRIFISFVTASAVVASAMLIDGVSSPATADLPDRPAGTVSSIVDIVSEDLTADATTSTTTAVAVAPTTALSTTVASTPFEDLRRAQERLTELGYWLGRPDGKAGLSTSQAVMAFQKTNGLSRTGKLDPATTAALSTASRPRARSGGDLIEIDKKRQVILVVRDGRVQWVFNTSTGTEKSYVGADGKRAMADTPTGRFTVNREVNASDPGPLGSLYRPKYFHGDGIAVHGAASVPAYPASHGCARVTNNVMDFIWSENLVPMGSTVSIY